MTKATSIAFGASKAVEKWSGSHFIDIVGISYFDKKFVGDSDNHVIQRLTDLETSRGGTIKFDLSLPLRQRPTAGDARIEGKAESLRFYSDELTITQLRHVVSAGDAMRRQRTVHSIRSICEEKLSDYWAKYNDQLRFIYLSGARGVNSDFIEDTAFIGHELNPIHAPDAAHLIYGGAATSKAALVAGDKMNRIVIEKAAIKAQMMRALDPTTADMRPVMINGEPHFVMLMSEHHAYNLRINDATDWMDIQKAAATAEGRSNPIFRGAIGMIKNVVLHTHASVIRFNDYGVDGNVPVARALLMGRQAGVVAYGSSGGLRMNWREEVRDYGSEPIVESKVLMGVKKTRYNDTDLSVIAIDCASD